MKRIGKSDHADFSIVDSVREIKRIMIKSTKTNNYRYLIQLI